MFRSLIMPLFVERSKALACATFAVLILSGCRCDENVVWSPDGKRAALLSESLRLTAPDGALSPVAGGRIERLQWLADNRQAIVVRESIIRSWKDLCRALTPAEQSRIIASAARIRAGSGYLDASPRINQIDLENFREACLYIRDSRGAAALADVVRRWHIEGLNDPATREALLPVIHTVQLVEIGGTVADARMSVKRTIFKSRLPVEDIRLAPGGHMMTILQGELNRLMLVDMSGSARIIALNSSRPDWSRDGGRVFYLHTPAQGEKQTSVYINSIPVVSLSSVSVNSSTTTSKSAVNRHDIAQLAGEIDISHGARSGMRVRVISKDHLLVAAHPLKLPATAGSFGLEPVCFFKVNTTSGAIEQIAIENLSRTARENNAISRFEPNQDGTMAAMIDDTGTVSVAPLAGQSTRLIEIYRGKPGDINEPVASSQTQPCWRTPTELCYVQKRRDDDTNLLVLQNIVMNADKFGEKGDKSSTARVIVSEARVLNAVKNENWGKAHISFLENGDAPAESSKKSKLK